MLKKVETIMNMSGDMDDIKITQRKLLWMNNTTHTGWIKRTLSMEEEKINAREDTAIKTSQNKAQGEKKDWGVGEGKEYYGMAACCLP